MKYYSKRLNGIHNHKANITMLAHLLIVEENEYLSKMLSGNTGEYERLVESIVTGEEMNIDGKIYFAKEERGDENILHK